MASFNLKKYLEARAAKNPGVTETQLAENRKTDEPDSLTETQLKACRSPEAKPSLTEKQLEAVRK